jgi:hypothetical protein
MTIAWQYRWYRCVGWLPGAFLVLSLGCGTSNIYPVEGQIVDAQGQPVTGLKGGAVEFESVEVKASASGDIGPDGRFRMTTDRPGDGAHLGKHRVLVARPYFDPDTPAPRVIDAKYEQYETAELEVMVEPRRNVITLTVERVGGR